jgi:hypothetical protein
MRAVGTGLELLGSRALSHDRAMRASSGLLLHLRCLMHAPGEQYGHAPPSLPSHSFQHTTAEYQLTALSSMPTSSSLSALTPPSPPPTLVPSILGSGACPERGAMYSESLSPSEDEEDEREEREGRDEVGEGESVGEKREGMAVGTAAMLMTGGAGEDEADWRRRKRGGQQIPFER